MKPQKDFRLLAISGSLRAASSNTAVLKAMSVLAAPPASVFLYRDLANLPLFNPDLDSESPPALIEAWRAEVASAAGLFFSTPEYAHGVPGALKNALDWLVSGIEIVDKPVALINPRPGSTWAVASLKETLSVMGARVIPAASLSLPLRTNRIDRDTLLADEKYRTILQSSLTALLAAIEA